MSQTDARAAELNRDLTRLLGEAGRRFGFEVVLEYPVRGGRLDVVWTWSPDAPFPGLSGPVPVVGFEIESSWRTRKHVKGDLLNLHDAGVGLGVIVLAGTDAKDDGLRRFAEVLVDRPGPKVLIWTADDVRALAGTFELPAETPAVPAAAAPAASSTPPGSQLPGTHAGKYASLYRWLRTQDRQSLTVKFAQVEEAIGMQLPNSCRHHVPHWQSYDGSAVARAIVDAGWKATNVNLKQESVTFVRTGA